MSPTLVKTAAACPHCGAPLQAATPARVDPALAALDPGVSRHDLEALAAEAREDKSYDESAKVRVTQQDIRKLLEKRRKGLTR